MSVFTDRYFDAATLVLEVVQEGEGVKEQAEGEGVWRTIRGRHVFIREGQSAAGAIAQSKDYSTVLTKLGLPYDYKYLKSLIDDPDLDWLAVRGKFISTVGLKEVLVNQNDCHRNASKLFTTGKIDTIVTGYAAATRPDSKTEYWYQHSWGLKDRKIVETTAGGYHRYFGVVLTKQESVKFAKRNNAASGQFSLPEDGPNNPAWSYPKLSWRDVVKEHVQVPTEIDYAQIKTRLDTLEERGVKDLYAVLVNARDRLEAKLRHNAKDLAAITKDLVFPGAPDLRDAFRDLLRRAWDAGGADARREVREGRRVVKGYVEWDESKHPREPGGSEKGGEFAPSGGGELWGQSKSFFPDDELPTPDIALVSYVGGGLLSDVPGEGLQIARDGLRRSFEKFPVEAAQVKDQAGKFLDRIAPGSKTVELYHVSSSPWSTFRDRGGFGEWRSFTYSKDAALRLLNEDLGGRGWVYTVRAPKSSIGAVIGYTDINIKEFAYQKEVLNDTLIPLSSVFSSKQFRSSGKKRTSFTEGEDVHIYAEPFAPRNALRWLREKTFWVTDLLAGNVIDEVRGAILAGMKTGELIGATVERVWTLFEKYIGDPTVLRDGEPLAPSRLETIVRTNNTDAYNQGRLAEIMRPDMVPFIKGILYSATLDERTTPVCEFLGKIGELGAIFTPQQLISSGLTPGNHFNCRSLIVPVIVGEEIDEKDFITEAQIAEARGLADAKFLIQQEEEDYTWDESKHPRDDHGKWTSIGGDEDEALDRLAKFAGRKQNLLLEDLFGKGKLAYTVADEFNEIENKVGIEKVLRLGKMDVVPLSDFKFAQGYVYRRKVESMILHRRDVAKSWQTRGGEPPHAYRTDKGLILMDGHTRLVASSFLGIKTMRVLVIDGKVASALTADKKKEHSQIIYFGWDESKHPRGGKGTREGGQWVSGRASRALATHVPATRERQRMAAKYEATVAKLIGGKDLGDNEPFDVVKGKHAVEVKAILTGKNPKITMHPESLARKTAWLQENKATGHTVVIDARGEGTKYYYKAGVGSFRLSAMREVGTKELGKLIR